MVESLNKEIPLNHPLHGKLLAQILRRRDYSLQKMQEFHSRWDEADKESIGYIPETTADARRRVKRDNDGHLDYVTLEIPYNYAVLASMHTYICGVFLSRSPVYQVTGRHGEGQDSIMAMEAALDYQRQMGCHLPVLYNWFWDAGKYGVGVIGEYWEEEHRTVSRIVEKEKLLLGMIRTGKMHKVRETMRELAFQGNMLYGIRPRDFFPDPRVPLYDFQKGEFCGRQIQVGLSDVLSGATIGRYFNLDALRESKGNKEELERMGAIPWDGGELTAGSGVLILPDGVGGTSGSAVGKNFLSLLEMVVKIVPSEWELGPGRDPEKWVFTVANERLIIGCRPLGLFHDRFPYSVIETGFGSEEFIKHSVLDHTRPLAKTLSWLFNTHMFNVRRAVNDTRVVDPSRVVMKDLISPAAGGIIRLKPESYGTDVRGIISQLPTQDVTMNHMRDSQVIEMLIQRVGGVTDNVMGMMSEGGRKTATEVRTASGFSINRIKTLAEYMSAVGFSPLVSRQISNTQQLMSMERKFAVAGSTAMDAQRYVDVDPSRLMGFFDFVPVDGSLPVDRLAQATFWKELIMQLARVPQLAVNWDLGRMLAHTMMLQGERNVDRFKVNVLPPGAQPGSTLPGNVVPIGGENGGNVAAAAEGSTGSALNII